MLKKRRKSNAGRPNLGSRPINLSFPGKLLARIDRWAQAQADQPGRAEAIKRMVRIATRQYAEDDAA